MSIRSFSSPCVTTMLTICESDNSKPTSFVYCAGVEENNINILSVASKSNQTAHSSHDGRYKEEEALCK